ncbi:MAG: DUF3303 family protein [Dehalococcoidales bacterium]
MLHMVVMTHGPDTCAAADAGSGEMMRDAMSHMGEATKKHGVTVKGAWINPPGHIFWILAEAPNAHAVNDLVTELKLFHWNTIDIHPIITLEDAMPLAK